MRYRVGFSPEAEAQLAGLYRYIAGEASPDIAQSFTSAIVEQCEALEHFPLRGTPRDDIRPGLRTIAFRRRVTIAYYVDGDQVIVLNLFYAGQNIEALIDKD
jgi:toxin ParE1/3/4